MTSLRTVAQSSATAVRFRPALVSKHRTLYSDGFGFVVGFVTLSWDGNRYAFGAIAGFRAPESNGTAEIWIRKSKAALRNMPKSSIAVAPSRQATQLCIYAFRSRLSP